MRIRNDVSIQKDEKKRQVVSTLVGKYDVRAEKQPDSVNHQAQTSCG